MKEFKPGWWRTDSAEIVPVFARRVKLDVGETWVFIEWNSFEGFDTARETSEIPMYFREYLGPFDGSDPR